MRNRKRLPALLLSLALTVSLCACGSAGRDGTAGASSDPAASQEPVASPEPVASQEPAASPEPVASQEPVPSQEPDPSGADLTQDAVAYATGLSPSDVLLTVNGEAVTADLFLYWLFWDCYYLDFTYYYYYGITVDLGSVAGPLLDGTVDTAVYYTVLFQKAAELGCMPTDAQKQKVLAELLADRQEGYYDSLKASYGLSDESMERLYLSDACYENLRDVLVPTVTEEMLNSYVYQVKHILLKTVDNQNQPLSDGEIAAQRALAEDILARLRAVEGEEQAALFDELMNRYSEDGRDGNGDLYTPDGYTAAPGEMVPEFEEASLALPIGGLSGIVESVYGYHIILRGEVEDMEAYADDYREYQLDRELDALVDAAEVTRSDALDELDLDAFYERYIDYQNAVME